jgi:hypothetical protein
MSILSLEGRLLASNMTIHPISTFRPLVRGGAFGSRNTAYMPVDGKK